LRKLEYELVAAQKELVALGIDPEKVSVSAPAVPPGPAVVEEIEEIDADDVEEVPRSNEPEAAKEDDGRAVTLSGSYKVKLPPYLSMDDVKAIQDGVTSAGNIAKKYASKRVSSGQAQPTNGMSDQKDKAHFLSRQIRWRQLCRSRQTRFGTFSTRSSTQS